MSLNDALSISLSPVFYLFLMRTHARDVPSARSPEGLASNAISNPVILRSMSLVPANRSCSVV